MPKKNALFGEDFHFDNFFSNGLKPPPRMVHQKTIKLDSARGKPNLFEGITSENSITRLHHHQKI